MSVRFGREWKYVLKWTNRSLPHDTTLFLGGKEYSTLEYISKFIGKTTVNYTNYNYNYGTQAGWSKSNQLVQRDLLDPAEIGKLKGDECLIHIRGHEIYRDKKFNLLAHKNIDYTTDSPDKDKAKSNIFKKENVLKYIDENAQRLKNNQNQTNMESISAQTFKPSNEAETFILYD